MKKSLELVEPYEYRQRKCDRIVCFYYFETEDSDRYSVRFMNLEENKKKQIWQTEFTFVIKDKVNTSKEEIVCIFKVISTIMQIIKEFIADKDPDGLNINASSNYKENMRRFYMDRFIPELPNWKKVWNPFNNKILLRKKT